MITIKFIGRWAVFLIACWFIYVWLRAHLKRKAEERRRRLKLG